MAFLVEGYMDCLKMSQAGIKNVVASLGTAFTEEQASLLHRYVEKVVLLYDGDEAGQRETLRASGLLQQEGLQVEILTLPGEMDPDEFVSAYGQKGFYDFFQEHRRSVIAFKLERWLAGQGERLDRESMSRLIRSLREDFRRLPGEMERDFHVELLTMKLGVPENLIRRELRGSGALANPGRQMNKPVQNWNNNTENYTLTERVVAAMLSDSGLFQQVADQIGLEVFGNEEDRALLKILGQKRLEDPAFGLKELQYEALEAGLEGRLARLQMIAESKRAADQVLIDDFIARVRKIQAKKQWESLLNRIQQMDESGANSDGIKKLLFQMNQVFHAEWKGDKK